MRRLLAFLVMVVVATLVFAAGGPGALLPLKAAAQAVTEVSVAFVVDLSGSGGVQSACVKVPSTDNGYQALALFTEQEHETAPTYNSSGLLCSIGGVPASGCGQAVGHQYIYWSYWLGDTGRWQYSNTGASGTVHACDAEGADCDVEGWKFEDPGAGNPTDPPPGSAPAYASICAGTTPSTTTTTRAPATTVPPLTTTTATRPPATAPGTATTTTTPASAGVTARGAAGTTAASPATGTATAAVTGATPASSSPGSDSSAPSTPATAGAPGAVAAQATPTGSLASTGIGPGARWAGTIGGLLVLVGLALWGLWARVVRLARPGVPDPGPSTIGGPDPGPRPPDPSAALGSGRRRTVDLKGLTTWILGR
ncbi:MAG TPA: hypothetical protein VMB82_10405 [Acidimicrobiales bacterium]|nr:hypothetical protein [Acidimicrobiales bacterium]